MAQRSPKRSIDTRPAGQVWREILRAAMAEFLEFGYEGATIRGIAERVGMLKGSLYNYISGKEDLFVAVVEGPSKQLIQAVRDLSEEATDAAEKLCRLMELEISIFSKHYPAPFVYLARTKEPFNPKFAQWDSEYLSALKELLQSGVDRKEFREDLDIEMSARAIVGMLAWMHAWYEPRSQAEDLRIVDAFWRLATYGIAQKPPQP